MDLVKLPPISREGMDPRISRQQCRHPLSVIYARTCHGQPPVCYPLINSKAQSSLKIKLIRLCVYLRIILQQLGIKSLCHRDIYKVYIHCPHAKHNDYFPKPKAHAIEKCRVTSQGSNTSVFKSNTAVLNNMVVPILNTPIRSNTAV